MVARTTKAFRATGSPAAVPSSRAALIEKYSSSSTKQMMMAETLPVKSALRSSKKSPAKTSHKNKLHDNDAAFDELKANLQRYTRGNDRRMAIRSLNECRPLRAIPIDGNPASPSSHEQWNDLEREVCFTSIELNGLKIPASSTSQILKILSDLCKELCRSSRLSSQSIYQAMIVRLARTTSSADSYFHLNALLGSQELVLKQITAPTPPTQLMMYESDGAIHVVLTTYHPYGLFRKCDVTSGKAWIPLHAAIHERVNFLTGDCFRHVGVQVVPDK